MINTAVILAAGLGDRIKEKFGDKPKGLIPIGAHAIIERSLAILEDNGITTIIIGTGYLSEHYEEMAQSRAITCFKNLEYASTGSFFTLYGMRDILKKDFLLLESDLLFERRAVTEVINHDQQDVILASGKTNSGDEVFIETDKANYLKNLSKNPEKVSNIYGELVGISKISIQTYHQLCMWAHENEEIAKHLHYEEAIAQICQDNPIYIERIQDLIWTEIDTISQYINARDSIFPKIVRKEL